MAGHGPPKRLSVRRGLDFYAELHLGERLQAGLRLREEHNLPRGPQHACGESLSSRLRYAYGRDESGLQWVPTSHDYRLQYAVGDWQSHGYPRAGRRRGSGGERLLLTRQALVQIR